MDFDFVWILVEDNMKNISVQFQAKFWLMVHEEL